MEEVVIEYRSEAACRPQSQCEHKIHVTLGIFR